MPPRRRNKASSARSAAIQAVEKRRRQQQSSQDDDDEDDRHRPDASTSSSAFVGADSVCSAARRSSTHNPQSNNSRSNKNNARTTTTSTNTTTLLDSNTDGCLHCLRSASESNIQVRCDECQSYICQDCHWCHEFQANHEIRVCDRCDAFYCRNCDEMDQCDDCGEVVCASCSTLLSCKFCGGGLCEECATACGRCGIVLCSRDAKFAVDCDTCRLSYCLVCLASGSKDSCVRCGHRPSKRMEQLVHLRLKSIYKAFKQSSRKANGMTIEELEETKNISSNSNDNGIDDEDEDDEEETLLSRTAAAGRKSSFRGGAGSSKPKSTSMNSASSSAATNLILETEKYMAEKQKADAAAEALLAELEEEEEAMKSKKSKKKRKKEKKHQQQAKEEQEKKQNETAEEERQQQQQMTMEEKETGDSPSRKKTLPQQSSSDGSPSSATSTPDNELPEQVQNSTTNDVDPAEMRFLELVEQEDEDGLEEFLFELKGIPGRGALRKNAKKALKRLRSVADAEPAVPVAKTAESSEKQVATSQGFGSSELLRLVSDNYVSKSNRVECVLQISPLVVGRVIGKGGQRIRDLMEESGAKVWIDQEKVSRPGDARNVYISGERHCVDQAVIMMKEIVSQSPAKNNVDRNGGEIALQESEHANIASKNVSTVENSAPASSAMAGSTLISQQIDRALKDSKNQGTSKKTAASASKPRALEVPLQPSAAPKVVPPTKTNERGATEDFAEQLLTCEARFVPLLIGKRGWTIKHIQDESGARVDIDQTVTPRQIHISGSKNNVDVAVAMVRDVLSYPHAQLIQNDEKQTIDVTNQEPPAALENKAVENKPVPNNGAPHVSPERDDHFSPPASLIMTGDSKSLISASSSLSSTPEPSMASNPPKGCQLPSGPLIPPEYHPSGGSNNHVLRSQAPPANTFNGQQEIGFDNTLGVMPRGFGAPYGNPQPSSIAIHQPPVGMTGPHQHHHHNHHHHHQIYNPAPKAPIPQMGSNVLEGFEAGNPMLPNLGNNMHQTHGHNFNNMIGNSSNNGPSLPFPGHAQTQRNPIYNEGNRQGNRMNNVVPPLGGAGMSGPTSFHAESNLAGSSGGLWNPSPAIARGATGIQKVSHDGYYVNDTRNQYTQPQQPPANTLPLRFDAGQAATHAGTRPAVQNSFVSSSLDPKPAVEPSGDDSKMVDSLFAPALNSNQTETLLSGFNGLAIGGESIEAPTGLWGASGLSSKWESGETRSFTDKKKIEDTSSDLLSGLPPLHLPDNSHQHPQQSRFNWGSTNA